MNNLLINNLILLPKYKLSFLFLLLLLVNSLCIGYVLNIFNLPKLETLSYFTDFNIDSVIILVIFGPVVEVLIFQFLVYLLLDKLNICSYYIVLSAVLFSIAHGYNISYVIKAFISGMLYAVLFYVIASRNKEAIEKAILFTVLVHSMHNMFGLFYDYIIIKP